MKSEIEKKKAFDRRYLKKGLIAGIDEAGRGALAGPVVSACVVFDVDNLPDIEVDDSKKLKPQERERLFDLILRYSVDFSVYAVGPSKIDEINIRRATSLCMERAFNLLKVSPLVTLIDGDFKPFLPSLTYNVVGGDGKSFVIASASIVAKVVRDRIMARYDRVFPGYGFSRNKGYGTSEHLEAIERLGVTPIHRKSYMPLCESRRKIGSFIEDLVCEQLSDRGFKIVDRNFYTRFGEIDIIAEKDGILYFVEVRGSRGSIDPSESITSKKKRNLKRAISLYLSKSKLYPREYRTLFVSVLDSGASPILEIFEDFIEG